MAFNPDDTVVVCRNPACAKFEVERHVTMPNVGNNVRMGGSFFCGDCAAPQELQIVAAG